MGDASNYRGASNVLDRVSSALGAKALDVTELDGGMVGTVYRVSFMERAPVAAKVDGAPLDVEADMLEYLECKTALPVPTVLHAEEGLLLMEYIDGDDRFDERAERNLGSHIAALHEVSANAFGFPFDTLSGPYTQSNPWTDSWIEFFRDHRLLPYAKAAKDEGTLPVAEYERVRRLAGTLDDCLVEPASPSLLHGDVHPGNVIVADGTVQAILDPAIYFGHNEIDLAYVTRSNSIGDAFLDEYQSHRGIPEAFFEVRKEVYEAFHILENVRFFGKTLLPEFDWALSRLGI